jgi:hypothetical protein
LEELYSEKERKRRSFALEEEEDERTKKLQLSEEETKQLLQQRDTLKTQLMLNICAARLKLRMYEDAIRSCEYVSPILYLGCNTPSRF